MSTTQAMDLSQDTEDFSIYDLLLARLSEPEVPRAPPPKQKTVYWPVTFPEESSRFDIPSSPIHEWRVSVARSRPSTPDNPPGLSPRPLICRSPPVKPEHDPWFEELPLAYEENIEEERQGSSGVKLEGVKGDSHFESAAPAYHEDKEMADQKWASESNESEESRADLILESRPQARNNSSVTSFNMPLASTPYDFTHLQVPSALSHKYQRKFNPTIWKNHRRFAQELDKSNKDFEFQRDDYIAAWKIAVRKAESTLLKHNICKKIVGPGDKIKNVTVVIEAGIASIQNAKFDTKAEFRAKTIEKLKDKLARDLSNKNENNVAKRFKLAQRLVYLGYTDENVQALLSNNSYSANPSPKATKAGLEVRPQISISGDVIEPPTPEDKDPAWFTFNASRPSTSTSISTTATTSLIPNTNSFTPINHSNPIPVYIGYQRNPKSSLTNTTTLKKLQDHLDNLVRDGNKPRKVLEDAALNISAITKQKPYIVLQESGKRVINNIKKQKPPGGAEAQAKLARRQVDIEKRAGMEIGNGHRYRLKLNRMARRTGKQEDKKNKENEAEVEVEAEVEGMEFDNTEGS